MSWRTVVISKPSKLDLKMGYLVVRDSESTVRLHISEISLLIVETTNSSITTALLSELIKNKIKVIFCDEKKNPVSELVAYYGCHNSSLKIKNQINWQEENKKKVWTSVVTEKIYQQAKNLDFFNLPEQASMLYGYIDELKFYDETNREGHAAKVYFNALFGKEFSRSDECPINAALNYGYSLILSCVNREIVSCGYLTQLGIFHDNMFNAFNLGCDLMEPFRPVIDKMVKEMNCSTFETEEKRNLQTILNNEFVIDGKRQTLINTIKIYTKSVLEAIETGDTSLIKYCENEL